MEDFLMQVKALFKVCVATVLSVAGATGLAQAPVELKVGDMAPAFSAPGSDGKTHTLAESLGKRALVLAWFPKAFTGG
jgi:thioredoxin-dependent peroxiredoxin